MNLVNSPAPPSDAPSSPPPSPARRLESSRLYIAAVAIFACGALIRLFSGAGFQGFGFDESIYRRYVLELDQRGFDFYPALCQRYVGQQSKPEARAELPPTRFLYVFSAWAAKRLFFGDAPPAGAGTPDAKNNDPVLVSLKRVSRWFSILSVGLVGLIAWRMLGPPVGLGAMALMAASPLSIHMGAHALIDGFFAFWAALSLWLLWENLQRPHNLPRLAAFGISLVLLVLAKESAIFVYAALVTLCLVSRWTQFGTVSRPLVVVGLAAPVLAVTILASLAGGFDIFAAIYRIFIAKAQTLPVVVATQDGPWHRYLLELLLIDPLVLLLAVAAIFTTAWQLPAHRFLFLFLAASYLLMCNVRYGMNVRFATIWALPLCVFASTQIIALASRAGRNAALAAIAMFTVVCAYGLRQYGVFFIDAAIYEPTPRQLLQATGILKDAPRR